MEYCMSNFTPPSIYTVWEKGCPSSARGYVTIWKILWVIRGGFRLPDWSSTCVSVTEKAYTRVFMLLPSFLRVYLSVRTCELFLCFVAIVSVRSIMLTSLFSLFYVTGEFHRFLHRGRALLAEKPWTSAKKRRLRPLSTTNQHCCVRFCRTTFVETAIHTLTQSTLVVWAASFDKLVIGVSHLTSE